MIYFFYVLAGVLSGIFGGLGMGGGTLLIPILTIFLNFDQKLAQGINLISFLVMALFSLYIHHKNGYIVTKHIFYIIEIFVIIVIFNWHLQLFSCNKSHAESNFFKTSNFYPLVFLNCLNILARLKQRMMSSCIQPCKTTA